MDACRNGTRERDKQIKRGNLIDAWYDAFKPEARFGQDAVKSCLCRYNIVMAFERPVKITGLYDIKPFHIIIYTVDHKLLKYSDIH